MNGWQMILPVLYVKILLIFFFASQFCAAIFSDVNFSPTDVHVWTTFITNKGLFILRESERDFFFNLCLRLMWTAKPE